MTLIAGSFVLAFAMTNPMTAEESDPGKTLRHIVMLKFADASSVEEIQTVVDAFRALPKKIPVIKAFEYGENNSPEELNDGFTHCFTVTFASEKDRAEYLPHPAHKAFVEVLQPHLDKVLVIDYFADE
jgi:hypothetical protein